jgi:hypothetical protein
VDPGDPEDRIDAVVLKEFDRCLSEFHIAFSVFRVVVSGPDLGAPKLLRNLGAGGGNTVLRPAAVGMASGRG